MMRRTLQSSKGKFLCITLFSLVCGMSFGVSSSFSRYAECGLTSESIKLFDISPDTSSGSLEAQSYITNGLLGNYYLQNNAPQKALEYFSKLANDTQTSSNLMKVFRTIAEVKLSSNELDDAINYAQKAIDLKKNDSQSLSLLAEIYLSKYQSSSNSILSSIKSSDSLDKAQSLLEQAHSFETSNTLVLENLAKVYAAKQEVGKLIECYKNIVLISPRNVNAQIILINIFLKTSKPREALYYLDNLIAQRKSFIKAYVWSAEANLSLGNHEVSLRKIKDGLLIEPTNPELLRLFDTVATQLTKMGGKPVIDLYRDFANEYPHSATIQKLFALKLERENANNQTVVNQWETVLRADPENSDTLLHLANIYKTIGNKEKAFELTSTTLQHDVTNERAYAFATQLLLEDKNTSEAQDLLEKGIRLSPGSGELYYLLSEVQLLSGMYKNASDTIERGVKAADPSAPLFAAYADLLTDKGEIEKADAWYKKALELSPQNIGISLKYYSFLLFNDEFDKAKEISSNLESSSSDVSSAEITRLLGEAAVFSCKLKEAVELFKKSLELNPKQPLLIVKNLQYMITMNDYDGAFQFVNSDLCKQQLPNEVRNRFLSIILFKKGDTNGAVKILKDLANSLAFDARLPIHQTEFDLYCDANDFEKATALVNKLAKSYGSTNRDVLLLKSLLLTKQKKYGESVELLKSAIAKFNSDEQLYNYLSSVLIELKQFDEAISYLRKAVELNPMNDNSLNSLGYLLADRNEQLDESLYLINKAHLQNPALPHIWDSKGWVLYRLGRYSLALKWLLAAQTIMGTDDIELKEHISQVKQALDNQQTH